MIDVDAALDLKKNTITSMMVKRNLPTRIVLKKNQQH